MGMWAVAEGRECACEVLAELNLPFSVAGAVVYWVEAMARDEGKAVKKWQQKALDRELKIFADNVVNPMGYTGKRGRKGRARKPSFIGRRN
ncbi:hypothetical protein [Desulfovibrio oxyclinae]|uniref:hypothetical protein n=1 Tax=Desulfovibrio oxyclinae TaxID=63560 RepID=UPI00036D1086|nr:hypothetical protein [Desulfovibrio oxyclinae]